MRNFEIVSLLKEYIILGIMILILFFVGYKIIYKKIMKGKKTIKRGKLILYGVSICYVAVVFGAVFLNRGNIYKAANLHIFSSYREAFNKMDIVSFRNIILNILLFIPLGFLLPIYSEKLKKVYKVVLIGFLTTLIIESVQYKTGIGIFEADDIFNNTLGCLIGYCIFMIYNNLKNKENIKYIMLYILPIVLTICTFAIIYIKYEVQETRKFSF